jgi:hypothetical protein
VLQSGFRVTVIDAAATPQLSTEADGSVPVKAAAPLFMRPDTCPVKLSPLCLSVRRPPSSGDYGWQNQGVLESLGKAHL